MKCTRAFASGILRFCGSKAEVIMGMNIVSIESRSNAKIKYVSRLINDSSFRKKEKKLVIENEVMIDEAISCGILPDCIFISENAAKKNHLLSDKYVNICKNMFMISDDVAEKISDLETPQGVTAVISLDSLPECKICSGGKYVLLERVADPGNIGTIIRTADAFGFDGIILTEGCADAYSPKAMRSTMGGIFRVPLTRCNLDDAVQSLKNCNIALIAAVLKKDAEELKSLENIKSAAIMIGNEAAGLSEKAIEFSDRKIYIGMKGKAESLNAAVAASIFMYTLS